MLLYKSVALRHNQGTLHLFSILSLLISLNDLSVGVLACIAGAFPLTGELPPPHSIISKTALYEHFHQLLIELVHSTSLTLEGGESLYR